MARANDPNIDCEPNGNFKPLQCSPVSDATTTVATDRTRTRTRKTRTRTSAGQQSCHCVYPANGTIVEGSEVLLGERERRPNCNRGMYNYMYVHDTVDSNVIVYRLTKTYTRSLKMSWKCLYIQTDLYRVCKGILCSVEQLPCNS